MVWEKAEDSKPPFAFDEEEKVEPDKKAIENEQENFRRELKSGTTKPEKPIKKIPIETVFDSRHGYKEGWKKKR